MHPYTFRAENTFLPTNLKSGDDPYAIRDSVSEIKIFLQAGIDAFFTDQPDIGIAARNDFIGREYPPARRLQRGRRFSGTMRCSIKKTSGSLESTFTRTQCTFGDPKASTRVKFSSIFRPPVAVGASNGLSMRK